MGKQMNSDQTVLHAWGYSTAVGRSLLQVEGERATCRPPWLAGRGSTEEEAVSEHGCSCSLCDYKL
jgi:hypothetical protein